MAEHAGELVDPELLSDTIPEELELGVLAGELPDGVIIVPNIYLSNELRKIHEGHIILPFRDPNSIADVIWRSSTTVRVIFVVEGISGILDPANYSIVPLSTGAVGLTVFSVLEIDSKTVDLTVSVATNGKLYEVQFTEP